MIKRPFFMLTQPKLNYDIVEPDPGDPELIPVPSNLILLLNQALDSSKTALIKKGDKVIKGDKLSLYNESDEYTISPVTGTINNIDVWLDALGNTSTCISITSDPKQLNTDNITTYDLKDDIESADKYLRTLPGAPPLKTLACNKINTIIITCTDMDLLSTTNQYIALKFLDKIKQAIKILKKISKIPKICITVPKGLNIEKEFVGTHIFETAMHYPSNLPEMILKKHLNIMVPAGKTVEDMGVCFISAEAAVSLVKAYKTKSASFEKTLTIIGKHGTRYRIKATIGTPLDQIFNKFGIHINEQDRIIIGGPMKGSATYTNHHPVLPDMDIVIVQDRDNIPELSDYPCVNCGKCIRICPVNIPVNILVRHLEADLYEEANDKYDLEACIECGLCAYVCTARIPLYQYIMLGKREFFKTQTSR